MAPLPVWLFFGVTVLSVLGGAFAAGYWVYRDATVRGSERPRSWGVWTVLLPMPVLPAYLYARRGLGERREWRERDRAAGTAAAALLGGLFVTAMVTPPDPYSQLIWTGPVAACCAVVAHVVATRQVEVHGPTQ